MICVSWKSSLKEAKLTLNEQKNLFYFWEGLRKHFACSLFCQILPKWNPRWSCMRTSSQLSKWLLEACLLFSAVRCQADKERWKAIKPQNYFSMNTFALAFEKCIFNQWNKLFLKKFIAEKKVTLWVCPEHYWGVPFNSRLSKYSPLFSLLHICMNYS